MTVKARFVDDQRKPYLVGLAQDMLIAGHRKSEIIKAMKAANKEPCDPPLLMLSLIHISEPTRPY